MTKPNEQEIARFQAQLALALLKRQLNNGDHLSAEQLAQLITHSAPPERVEQWKQHLNECNDCYGVFLDVAQAHVLPNETQHNALIKIEFGRWRYVLGFALPVALVALLYFSWPQQQLLQTINEQTRSDEMPPTMASETATYGDEKNVQEKTHADDVVPQPTAQRPVVAAEITKQKSSDATPSAQATAELTTSPRENENAIQTITPEAIVARQENDALSMRQRDTDDKKVASINAIHSRQINEPTRPDFAPLSLPPPPEAASASAPQKANNDCTHCNADDQFDRELTVLLTEIRSRCKNQSLDIFATQKAWRELLDKHNTMRRDKLINTPEPVDQISWCKYAAQLDEEVDK